MSTPERLIVGVTGASGAVYAVRLLQALRDTPIQTHLVMSDTARRVVTLEAGLKPEQLEALADHAHSNRDLEAPIASGSFQTLGMVVVPCSIKTLSAVAHCFTESLLVRAADVVLKERRRLVLVVRETPLHLGHLRLMQTVTEYGAVVLPPAPGFYQGPQTIEDLVDHTVGKILDQFGVQHSLYRRWEGSGGESRPD